MERKQLFTKIKINPIIPRIADRSSKYQNELKDLFIQMESLIQHSQPNTEQIGQQEGVPQIDRKRKRFATLANTVYQRRKTIIDLSAKLENLKIRSTSKKRPTLCSVRKIVAQLGTSREGVITSLLKDKSMEIGKYMSDKSRNMILSPKRKASQMNVVYRDELRSTTGTLKLNDDVESSFERTKFAKIGGKTTSNFSLRKVSGRNMSSTKTTPNTNYLTPMTNTKAHTTSRISFSSTQTKLGRNNTKLTEYKKVLRGQVWKSFDNMEHEAKTFKEIIDTKKEHADKLLDKDTGRFKILSKHEIEIMREDFLDRNKHGYLYWYGKGEYTKSVTNAEAEFKIGLENFNSKNKNTHMDTLNRFRKLNLSTDKNIFIANYGKGFTKDEIAIKEKIEKIEREKELMAVKVKSEKLKCLLYEFNFRGIKK